jgi:SpoVK/Ycf46/Vps4 family AAA+-type ATPase
MSGALKVSDDIADLLISGKVQKPSFNIDFPASRISTELEWKDLVLDHKTLEELSEIKAWVKHGRTLMNDWDMKRWVKPGYKCLFYGPPGTGKTLAASLIGKHLGQEVYRIDLSMIVSKYIGETEKNLSKVFDRAANKDWILFFDEADALFGKRTEVSDSHDRYANQEVSFLLQKLEEHPGLVILSSNFKSNIDEAFTRRFQAMIAFSMPREKERETIWNKAFSAKSELAPDVDIQKISEDYELSGGSIVSAIRYASLMALRHDTNVIKNEWLLTGIRNEFRKAGKTL